MLLKIVLILIGLVYYIETFNKTDMEQGHHEINKNNSNYLPELGEMRALRPKPPKRKKVPNRIKERHKQIDSCNSRSVYSVNAKESACTTICKLKSQKYEGACIDGMQSDG